MKVEFDKSFYKSFDKNANSVLAKKLKRVIKILSRQSALMILVQLKN